MIFHICICQFIKVVLMDYKEGAVRVVCNRCESSRQTLARVGREAGRSLRNFFLFSFLATPRRGNFCRSGSFESTHTCTRHARAKLLFGEMENSDRSKTRERIGCERILDHGARARIGNGKLADRRRATGEKKRRGRRTVVSGY